MTLSTRPYPGSRDFYPDEMRFRNWMFAHQRSLCEAFGYTEYAAPLIEPIELYRAKSSEEIVNDQVYRFVDRGEREVVIRPELTPTLARMASARIQQLVEPLRWYNIGNFMRYERPGRGRLREFYQLNVDLMGEASSEADCEVLALGVHILKGFGATAEMFRVRYSDRRILESYLRDMPAEQQRAVSRVIDKRDKTSAEDFEQLLIEVCPDEGARRRVHEIFEFDLTDVRDLAAKEAIDPVAASTVSRVAELGEAHGYADALSFDPTIVRGFDYYTGFIFEIYDLHPENRRALFGGGRYDKLIGLFGKRDVPAVGFGMGDVTLENFLRSHGLVPESIDSARGVFVALMDEGLHTECVRLAAELRDLGIECELSLRPTKKFGKQLELATRKGRRFAAILGEEEMKNQTVRIKDLSSGEQADVPRAELGSWFSR